MNEDSELSTYIDQVNEEYYQLPNSVISSALFMELMHLLTEKYIDPTIFILNKELFYNFLEYLQGYNTSNHEAEILNGLKEIALNLLHMLKAYNLESDDSYDENKNSVLEKRIKSLKNGISTLENQQKVINEQNQSIIGSQQEANRIIEELKNKNEAYSQLIDEDSNARILKLYDEIYDREIEIADKYRNWALIIFTVVGILVASVILVSILQNTFAFFYPNEYFKITLGWESLIKTFMLFSLTTPAWYLTKESSKHRKVAYKAQMLGTELASFPLYVREFKDEDRLELRKHLADRFFGQELYSDSKTTNSNDNSLEQMKLMNETNKVLAEALKAKKIVES